MKIALVQAASPGDEAVAVRRDRVGTLVRAARGADLVVLPELWGVGYFAFDRYTEQAETLDGVTVAAGREWARELGCYVHLGSIVERAPDGRLHNTAVLLDPAGDIAHVYRKVHVFGYGSRESELLAPGDSVSVVDTPLGRFGVTTCYDLRFPEHARRLVDAGAEVLVLPAAWLAGPGKLHHWRTLLTARAIENTVFVLAAAQPAPRYTGHSLALDPMGRVLGEAGDDAGRVDVVLERSVLTEARETNPSLANRRL